MRDLDLIVAPPACLVADGGWGTEFLRMGLQPGASPEHWNLLYPERVLQVAQTYIEAGAQIILTNTFGGNAYRLKNHSLEESLETINLRGAEISREAAGDRVLVFGSMGPSGKLLAMRKVKESDLFETFRRQAESLARGGVDAILIETMGELQELQIAALAARAACDLPLVLSMTFDSGSGKLATMMGVTPEQAVREMEKLGAWMVGANCGIGPESYIEVCMRMRAVTAKPILIKPNAGIPVLHDGEIVYSQTPDRFGAFALKLREAGATVIGGCCGTTPAHVSRLCSLLQAKAG